MNFRHKISKALSIVLLTCAVGLPHQAAAQTDMTSRIQNPSFETNGTEGWTNTNMVAQTNSAFARKSGSTYMEKWVARGNRVGDAWLRQTITLPIGRYRLTVAAQNYNESYTSQNCTGTYIYAGTERTTVYTPRDYIVTFTQIGTTVEIGYKAEGATGNWLAVDNFRLTLIESLTDEEVVGELTSLIEKATSLQSSMMSAKTATSLQQAIDTATPLASEEPDLESIQQAADALTDAIFNAEQSIAEYAALQKAIDSAEAVYNESKNEAEAFRAALDNALALVANPDATSTELAAEIETLANATLAFRIANGTGTAPTATTNTKFIIPAAHGALIRATFSGSNIIERGICWSTERDPKVTDHRSTDYYSQQGTIYHIKNMEPAKVYYARAYAITGTYAVGYGDVVKVVTLPKGGCIGTWDNGAPDAAANERCRTAIQQTIDYLNEWTAIKGFTLSGHYGASTPTADCSYGGWMRIGPNSGNQAIGTVIHETGHGVGVGTHWRWNNCADTRANTTYGKWLGSWANKTLRFLENTESEAVFMTGDGVHGWGENASFDWFVNGADKDKHVAIQYIGGCALLYSLYIDGLCPTTGYPNGVPGYTFNFDDTKKYYIRCEDSEHGLNDGFVYQRSNTGLAWKSFTYEEIDESAAWMLEYVPNQGYYRIKNAETGRYMTHSATGTAITMKSTTSPGTTENFQFMPGRKDVTIRAGGKSFTAPTYWFTWSVVDSDNKTVNKSMVLADFNELNGFGRVIIDGFNYSNNATTQRFMLISEDELEEYHEALVVTGIQTISQGDRTPNGDRTVTAIYNADGRRLPHTVSGLNIIRYSDGTSKKLFIK